VSLHFDEKGKFYTDYISKNAVKAVVQTTTHLIYGFIYVRTDERVSDELNREERFLAITDAVVYSLAGEELYRSEFLAVNRSLVVWVMPKENDESTSEAAVKEIEP
jgi:hypothetical protein